MTDVLTVMWKEARELLSQRGIARGVGIMLVILAVFGVFLPLELGSAWLRSLADWTWVPFFLVATVIADSFAGERERHTLETLLASRLPDQAILIGKIGAAVAYGWGLTAVSLLLGLLVVNLGHSHRGLPPHPLAEVVWIMAVSVLAALLAAAAGVLVSLRAPTVRYAEQTLMIGILLLVFLPGLGLRALPNTWKAPLLAVLTGASATRMWLLAVGVLAVLDLTLLGAAILRFRRSRLVQD